MSDTDRGELPWDRPKADADDGDLFAQPTDRTFNGCGCRCTVDDQNGGRCTCFNLWKLSADNVGDPPKE